MRLLLFSDIHAMLPAISAVRRIAEAEGVDRLWCLGDVLGYGTEPVRTLQRLRLLLDQYGPESVCLLGNHDDEVAHGRNRGAFKLPDSLVRDSPFQNCALLTIAKHRTLLRDEAPDDADWLAELKPTAQPLAGYYLAHGFYQPVDERYALWEYGTHYPELIRAQLTLVGATANGQAPPLHLIANGHSHVPGVWHFEPKTDTLTRLADPLGQPWFDWDNELSGGSVVINVGSVSLPRPAERPIGSTCVLLDVSPDGRPLRLGFRPVPFDWRPLMTGGGQIQGDYPCAEALQQQLQQVRLPA